MAAAAAYRRRHYCLHFYIIYLFIYFRLLSHTYSWNSSFPKKDRGQGGEIAKANVVAVPQSEAASAAKDVETETVRCYSERWIHSLPNLNRRAFILATCTAITALTSRPDDDDGSLHNHRAHAADITSTIQSSNHFSIPEAVTTSDLGVSVRRSVVRGAQWMDRIDGQWEAFSDRYQLGANRKKQVQSMGKKRTSYSSSSSFPAAAPPLDAALAATLVALGDQVFLALLVPSITVRETDLMRQVQNVAVAVSPSFARSSSSGLSTESLIDLVTYSQSSSSSSSGSIIRTGEELNFVLYCHYKAYSDLLHDYEERLSLAGTSNKTLIFNRFYQQFQREFGSRALALLLLPHREKIIAGSSLRIMNNIESSSSSSFLPQGSTNNNNNNCDETLNNQFESLDQLYSALVRTGLVTSIKPSSIPVEEILDYCSKGDDDDSQPSLAFTVALAGDVTLQSQILLQEQGIRLYPSVAKCAIQALLLLLPSPLLTTTTSEESSFSAASGSPSRRRSLLHSDMIKSSITSPTPHTAVTIMDYYMDTDYHPDPAQFEVREIVLNIEMERT